MWWINKTFMRADLALSIFFIMLTIIAILFFSRAEAYQEEITELPVGSWWCHIDTPHGWIDHYLDKKNGGDKMAHRDRENDFTRNPRMK